MKRVSTMPPEDGDVVLMYTSKKKSVAALRLQTSLKLVVPQLSPIVSLVGFSW